MELNLNLDMKEDKKKAERVKKAIKKKVKYIPTFEEVWHTGYKTHTGSIKKGIYQTKITDNDLKKLRAVEDAIEQGELGIGVEDLSKFSKSHALNLYKVLAEMRREGIIKRMVEEMPNNYHCIMTHQELYALANKLDHEKIIAVDTETTGVDIWGNDVIVGVSLTLPKSDYHCYIPIRHMEDVVIGYEQKETGEMKPIIETVAIDGQLKDTFVMNVLKPFMEDVNLKKVMHNAKFDIHMMIKEGIYTQGLFMDTMVAMHLLNENEPSFALKNLATKYGEYFGFEDKSMTYEELFGKGGFEKTPLDIGTVYACKDTHLTYKFHEWIMTQFERLPKIKDLYFNVELPITQVCVEMEQNGFAIDLDFAKQYGKELQHKIKKLEKKIAEGFGDININSNQQLADVIFNQWGVQDNYKGKVDAQTLKQIVVDWERLKPQVSAIRDLLDYRQLNKLLTTYIEPLPNKVCKMDGRLHGSFNQSSTATGRFASNNPNLQNLPYDARKLIVAPKGKVIIGIDYSQIEPRVLSHMASDDKLKDPYITGKDLYSSLASTVFDKPIEECGDGSKWRKLSKVVLLATMYGTSTYTLSKQVGISEEDAQKVIDDFYNSYEDVAKFINDMHDKADTEGFVETMFGRKRRFIGHKQVAKRFKAIDKKVKDIVKKDKFNIWQEKNVSRELKTAYWEIAKEYGRVNRQSVNAVIQGSSADIMKIAMVEVAEHLRTKGKEWKILATIHDEILMEIPVTATHEEIMKIAEIQRDAVKLSIPFKVDIEMSERWGCGCSYKEWATERGLI